MIDVPELAPPADPVPPGVGRFRSAVAMSERLAKAISHQLRVRILLELNHEGELSPKQFKDLTGVTDSVQTIAKHFRRLEGLGCAEMAGTRPSGRGSIERVFCATRRPDFDRQALDDLPAQRKQGTSERAFTTYVDRIAEAFDADTFDARPNRHFAWANLVYDEIAWNKMIEAIDALFWWSLALWAEAESRLEESGEEPIPVTSALTFIEAPEHMSGLNGIRQFESAPFFLEEEEGLFFNPNLAAALTHELRIWILIALNRRAMSPRAFHEEFGKRLGVDLPKVAQHFRRLEQLNCIDMVGKRVGRRGRPEHVFCSARSSLFDGSAWSPVPPSIRAEISALTVTTYIDAFAEAMRADTVDKRLDSHFSWVGMHLDEKAWLELVTAMAAVFRYSECLAEESKVRLGNAQRLEVPVIVAMGGFEAPRGAGVTPAASLRKLSREAQPDLPALRQALDRIVAAR